MDVMNNTAVCLRAFHPDQPCQSKLISIQSAFITFKTSCSKIFPGCEEGI